MFVVISIRNIGYSVQTFADPHKAEEAFEKWTTAPLKFDRTMSVFLYNNDGLLTDSWISGELDD